MLTLAEQEPATVESALLPLVHLDNADDDQLRARNPGEAFALTPVNGGMTWAAAGGQLHDPVVAIVGDDRVARRVDRAEQPGS